MGSVLNELCGKHKPWSQHEDLASKQSEWIRCQYFSLSRKYRRRVTLSQHLYKYFDNRADAIEQFLIANVMCCVLHDVNLLYERCKIESDIKFLYYLVLIDRFETMVKFWTTLTSYNLLNSFGDVPVDLISLEQPSTPAGYSESMGKWYFPLTSHGAIRNYRWKCSFNRSRIVSLAFDILQIKRGCAPIPPTMVEQSFVDYATVMSTPPPSFKNTEKERIWDTIVQSAAKIVSQMPVDEDKVDCGLPGLQPHPTGCYDFSTENGGCVHACADRIGSMCSELGLDEPRASVLRTHPEYQAKVFQHVTMMTKHEDECLLQQNFNNAVSDFLNGRITLQYIAEFVIDDSLCDYVWADGEIDNNGNSVYREYQTPIYANDSCGNDPDEFSNISCDWMVVETGVEPVQQVLNDSEIFGNLFGQETTEIDHVLLACLREQRETVYSKVHGVLEPLKQRIITASDALFQTYLSLAQQTIANSYRRLPMFKLVGETLKPAIINEFLDGNAFALSFIDSFIVSGDYKSATDYINMELTLIVWEMLCKHFNFSTIICDLGKSILCGNMLDFSSVTKKIPNAVLQRNGQLMGCIISFPILSIINAACVLAARDLAPQNIRSRFVDSPILVNGDDILFTANHDLYQIWKDVIGVAGFKLSAGKNYISRTFCVINSQPYILCYTEGMDAPYGAVHMPFLPIGLCMGQSRVLNDTRDPEHLDDYGAKYRAMVEQIKNTELSLGLNQEQIKQWMTGLFFVFSRGQLGNRSWYLPNWLGGAGLPANRFLKGSEARLAYKYHHSSVTEKVRLSSLLNANRKGRSDYVRQLQVVASKRQDFVASTEETKFGEYAVSITADWLNFTPSVDARKYQHAKTLERMYREVDKKYFWIDEFDSSLLERVTLETKYTDDDTVCHHHFRSH